MLDQASSDDELAGQAARGERAAMELLLERHAEVALRAAYAVLQREDLAADAAQTALSTIANRMAASWRGGSMKAWIAACSHRAAVNLLVAERKQAQRLAGLKTVEIPEPHMTAAEREELYTALHQELAQESEETSAALILHHVNGLSVAAVASELGLETEACKKRLARGRERIRERLERRGVTAESLAFVPALLAESERIAHALRLDPALPAKVVKAAITAKAPAALSAGVAKTILGAGMKWTAAAAFLVAAVAITVATVKIRAHHGGGETRGDENAGNAATIAPSGPAQWQTPRFIEFDASEVFAQSLSASGKHISIPAFVRKPAVAVRTSSDISKGVTQVLIQSDDGGQTWRSTSVNLGKTYDACVSVRPDGSGSILSGGFSPEGLAKLGTQADGFMPGRYLWYPFSPGGKLGSAETSWGRDEWVLVSHMIAVPDGSWVFTQKANTNVKADANIELTLTAAYGAGNSCPSLLSDLPKAGALTAKPAAAWATNDKTAGFVSTEMENGIPRLISYQTTDGGTTWQSSKVDFAPASANPRNSLEAICATTADKRLALLVEMGLGNGKSQKSYLMTSADLGRTWSAPRQISRSDERNHVYEGKSKHWEENYRLFGGKDLLALGYYATEIDKLGKRSSVPALLLIENDGSIKRYGGFAAAESQGGFAFGGDADALYVAVPHIEEKKCWLMIHSFAPGKWTAPRTPAPAWFHPEKLTLEEVKPEQGGAAQSDF